MRKTISSAATMLGALACLALAGCDREATNRAGQKVDQAMDRTQQKLADAGGKLTPRLERAGEKISEAAQKAGDKISDVAQRATVGMKDSVVDNTRGSATTSTTANGASATISTGDRTSLSGISPETRAVLGDTAITASIKADYLKDPDLSVLKIEVDTTGGVVTLKGSAESEAARKRAEQIAANVKGVTQVRNNLIVKKG